MKKSKPKRGLKIRVKNWQPKFAKFLKSRGIVWRDSDYLGKWDWIQYL